MIWALLGSLAVIVYLAAEFGITAVMRKNLVLDDRLEEVRKTATTQTERNKRQQAARNRAAGRNIRISGALRDRIELSGLNVRPEDFVMIWVFLALAPAALVFVVTGNITFVPMAAAVGAVLPLLVLNMAINRRRNLFEVQLGDALLIISNGLRAGFSFIQALSNVTGSLPDPIHSEFDRVIREVNLGMDLETSMETVAVRMKSDDLKLLTTAVVIQQQVGGNLSEILDTVSGTIRERLKIKRSVQTMTAQGQLSGRLVGALPFVLLLVISVLNRSYVMPLFTTDMGHLMLLVGGVLEAAGFFWISRIVKIKF